MHMHYIFRNIIDSHVCSLSQPFFPHTRVNKILEQLLRKRVFTGFEIPALFSAVT